MSENISSNQNTTQLSASSTSRFTNDASPPVVIGECEKQKVTSEKVSQFYVPFVDHIMMNENQICNRIEQMAEIIYSKFKNSEKELVFFCTLKGACRFFEKFTFHFRKLHLNDPNAPLRPAYREEYLSVSSYMNTESTGQVKVSREDFSEFKNYDVVIFEDILDTGRTLQTLSDLFHKSGVNSVSTCVLVEKRIGQRDFMLDGYFLIGFSVPNVFLVGYGVDYNQRFRDIDHICVVSAEGVNAFKSQ